MKRGRPSCDQILGKVLAILDVSPEFCDCMYPANLLPMPMNDFDIIFGMDWLSEHGATIHCETKRILFGYYKSPDCIYYGHPPAKTVRIISALKAQKIIVHGCEGFLASIKDTSVCVPSIESHPVVCEFPDVFPDELPGLPPVREIEFLKRLNSLIKCNRLDD